MEYCYTFARLSDSIVKIRIIPLQLKAYTFEKVNWWKWWMRLNEKEKNSSLVIAAVVDETFSEIVHSIEQLHSSIFVQRRGKRRKNNVEKWENNRHIRRAKKKKKNKGRKKINSAFVYKFMCVYLHSLHLYTARLSLSVLLDMIHIHIMESFFFIYEKTRSRLTFCPKMYNAHYCWG